MKEYRKIYLLYLMMHTQTMSKKMLNTIELLFTFVMQQKWNIEQCNNDY